MTRTITGEIFAYLPEYGDPAHLRGPDIEALGAMVFSTCQTMATCGWTLVGVTTISVELVGEKQLVENKVESLRAQKASVMAKATATATEIERKIQNLLAINYDGETS